MPYAMVETNLDMNAEAARKLALSATELLATELGKPEKFVMVSVHPGASLVFGGNDEPAAYVELKSIGLPQGACASLAASLCAMLETRAGISRDRVYVEFKDLERSMFGWNGGTF